VTPSVVQAALAAVRSAQKGSAASAATTPPRPDGSGGGWMLPFPTWLVPVPALSVPEALSRYGAKLGISPGPGGATMAASSARAHPMEPHVRDMHPEDHGRMVHLHGFKRLAAGGQLNADTVGHWLSQVLGAGGSGAAGPLVSKLDDRNAVLTFPSVGLAGRALDSLTSDVIDKYSIPFQVRLWGVGVPAVLQGVPLAEIDEDGRQVGSRPAALSSQEGVTVIRGWGSGNGRGSSAAAPPPTGAVPSGSVAQRVAAGLARDRSQLAAGAQPPGTPAAGSSWSRAATAGVGGGSGAWGRGPSASAGNWRTGPSGATSAAAPSAGEAGPAGVMRVRTGTRRAQDSTRSSSRDAW